MVITSHSWGKVPQLSMGTPVTSIRMQALLLGPSPEEQEEEVKSTAQHLRVVSPSGMSLPARPSGALCTGGGRSARPPTTGVAERPGMRCPEAGGRSWWPSSET